MLFKSETHFFYLLTYNIDGGSTLKLYRRYRSGTGDYPSANWIMVLASPPHSSIPIEGHVLTARSVLTFVTSSDVGLQNLRYILCD